MRRPSREMPPYRAEAKGALSWLALVALLTILAYGIWQGFPNSVALLAVIAIWAVIGTVIVRRRLANVARQRQGAGICEFARAFDARTVDSWIIRATFEQLQGHLASYHSEFPLRAEDELGGNLNIDPDDLECVVREIAQRAGRSVDSTESNPHLGKVISVRDLVMFIQAQPRAGEVRELAN